jgi:hypothetical protein
MCKIEVGAGPAMQGLAAIVSTAASRGCNRVDRLSGGAIRRADAAGLRRIGLVLLQIF